MRQTTKTKNREQERFRRRLRTYIRNAEKLRVDFGIQIYTIVHKGDKYWEYRSITDSTWPPSHEKLATIYPVPIRLTPNDFNKREPPSKLSMGSEPDNETGKVE